MADRRSRRSRFISEPEDWKCAHRCCDTPDDLHHDHFLSVRECPSCAALTRADEMSDDGSIGPK